MRFTPQISSMRSLRAWWEHRVLFEPKDWIQVEVTSHCNAACTYCPRTGYRKTWKDRSLPLELFERLIPAFGNTGLVYLQGWGEPLLHPALPVMIAAAKARGARVGATTNGMLLDVARARALIEAGLDILAFSLAGTTAAYNDRVRGGTRLEVVLEKIVMMETVKRECRSRTPVIHIAYMLLASGLAEIQQLPELLAGTPVSQVVVSLLDFAPDESSAGEVLDPTTEVQRDALETIFDRLRAAGKTMDIAIYTPRLSPVVKRDSCSENIQRALCVSAEGEVSPCVLTNLPVTGGRYCDNGRHRPYRRLIFGNIHQDLLPVIWRSPAYGSWRAAHAVGAVPDSCAGCRKLSR